MTSPAGVDEGPESGAAELWGAAEETQPTPWNTRVVRKDEENRSNSAGVPGSISGTTSPGTADSPPTDGAAGAPPAAGSGGAAPGSPGGGAAGPNGALQPAGSDPAGAPGSGGGAGSGVPAPAQVAPSAATGPEVGASAGSPQSADVSHAGSDAVNSAAPLIDPDTVAKIAPAVLSAAPMLLGMLPMLASALGGGGSGSTTAAGQTTGTGTGLTPQAQKALQALQLLKSAYGNGSADTPGTGTSGSGTGSPGAASGGGASAGGTGAPGTGSTGSGATGSGSGTGSSGGGSASTALTALRLYQHTAAATFNNLDNQLAGYITSLAGSQGVNRTALNQLLREVDVALAHLGTGAYSAAGQQQVHAIMTQALERAQTLVAGGHATSSDLAAAINQLTGEYLYNLSGKSYPGTLTAGTTTTAQQAISVALSEVGKPYVYGAEGPNSFDCSGLTQYSAASAGVSIPRTAAEQYQNLPKVAPANIRPGDLIFPAAEYNNGSPGHVMLYIGNGQCVEAPHTGASVRVVSLPSSFAASRWT
ncbi:C40 family peptidase [Nocardia sp. NBC_01388]|uniref:C40 family peptidase n=1 Tax=Nocardia sp. NBC_01388 TaxID=2903596 RepID=UPI00325134EA